MIRRIVFAAVALASLAVAYSIDQHTGFAFGVVAGLCGEALRS